MWQRFSYEARKAVFFAQEEAQKFGEGHVSTEHIALGFCREECRATIILRSIGIDPQVLKTRIERQIPAVEPRPTMDMTLTPRAKRVIDLAYDEARNLRHDYIGTEHLLLGLLAERDGLAGRVLLKLGVDIDAVREVARVMPTPTEYENKPGPRSPRKDGVQTSAGFLAVKVPGLQLDFYVLIMLIHLMPAVQTVLDHLNVTASSLIEALENQLLDGSWSSDHPAPQLKLEDGSHPFDVFRTAVLQSNSLTHKALLKLGKSEDQLILAVTRPTKP